MKHQIKIFYTTGDSFGHEDTSQILELEWNNLDVAKENLKRIREHYICYKVKNDYSGKKGYFFEGLTPEEKLMYDLREQQPWYKETYGDYCDSIILKTDDGKDYQLYPFWVGYFEQLNSAEILSKDNDMSFYF